MPRSRPHLQVPVGLFCLLGWIVMAGACGAADSADGGRQQIEGSAMAGDGNREVDDQGAIDAVRAQMEQGLTLVGEAADQAFARQLIADPPLPPDVVRRTRSEVRARLRTVFGESIPPEAFLFGGPAALSGDGECNLVSYQELLSGGVNVCLDATTQDILAIWLIPEG